MAYETKDFQKVLGDLFKKVFEKKGEHAMGGCFIERKFNMILSIAAFKAGLGSVNDSAISFALTV